MAIERSEQFEGYDESRDWEKDYPNPNRRYTVVTHHMDREHPEVRKAHFNTFEQARAYGVSLAFTNDIVPNPDMHYSEERDGRQAAVYDRRTGNQWGVILKSAKVNGRWRPHRDGDPT